MDKLFLIFFLLCTSLAADNVQGVKIQKIVGNNCKMQMSGEYHWTDAKTGWILSVGDRARTYNDSEIELFIAQYGSIRIGKNSVFDIKKSGNRKSNINNIGIDGIAWGNINSRGPAFMLYVQNAMLRMKECSFKVYADSERQTVNVIVFSGHLYINANGREFLMEASEQTVLSAHFGPMKPFSIDKDPEEAINAMLLEEYDDFSPDTGDAGMKTVLEQKNSEIYDAKREEKNLIKQDTFRRNENHIKIKNIKIAGIDMDEVNDRLTLYRDDLEDKAIVVSGTVSGDIYPVETVQVSINNGCNWETAEGTTVFSYAFKVKNSNYYNIKIDARDKQGNNAFESRRRFIVHYIHRTNREVLRSIVDDFSRAYKDEDEERIMQHIHDEYDDDKISLSENLEDFFFVNDPVFLNIVIGNIVIEGTAAKVSCRYTKRSDTGVVSSGFVSFIFEKDSANVWKLIRQSGNKIF